MTREDFFVGRVVGCDAEGYLRGKRDMIPLEIVLSSEGLRLGRTSIEPSEIVEVAADGPVLKIVCRSFGEGLEEKFYLYSNPVDPMASYRLSHGVRAAQAAWGLRLATSPNPESGQGT